MLVVNDRFALISAERDRLEEKVRQLEDELAVMEKHNRRLENEVEYLRIATTITPGRDTVEQTRELLAELIREVDKCIADLKE